MGKGERTGRWERYKLDGGRGRGVGKEIERQEKEKRNRREIEEERERDRGEEKEEGREDVSVRKAQGGDQMIQIDRHRHQAGRRPKGQNRDYQAGQTTGPAGHKTSA